MSERKEGYFYLERTTSKDKDVYEVSHELWSLNEAFQRFEEANERDESMPGGQNVIELYDGPKLIARHTF
ncbi:MAG: hypothetical protein LDL41_04115 [Coleofasciculus sp. S288]|nr:hypothetical protein [Coleofasciculus sp. S288]